MKNLILTIFILLIHNFAFAGASAEVSNSVGNGYMMGSMNSDLVPGNPQGFSFKIHTGKLAIVVVSNSFGTEARCLINGDSDLAEDFYNTLAHIKDGSVFFVYHDQSTDPHHGICTGFQLYSDTRFMTQR